MSDIGNYFRTKAILHQVRPSIRPSDKLLDIGAGWCHIPKTLSTKYKADVTAIDIVDNNHTDFPLELYDGEKLPYKDHSFDIGLLIFVLHHADNIEQLLKDACSVCAKLIIIEDMPGNRLEAAAWRKIDYLLNHLENTEVDTVHSAKTSDEWRELFDACGLQVEKQKKFRSLFTSGLLYPHILFMLSKK